MSEQSGDYLYGKIEKGKSYSIEFNEEAGGEVFSLQYGFKPVDIDMSKEGSFSVFERVSANVELSKTDNTIEVFKGSVDDSIDNEYLLIFENNEFRLAKLTANVTDLKPIRSESRTTLASGTRGRKNVTSEIKMRVASAKKRKLAEVASVPSPLTEPVIKPVVEEIVQSTNSDINSLDDLFS